jgi:hypothetical protein
MNNSADICDPQKSHFDGEEKEEKAEAAGIFA